MKILQSFALSTLRLPGAGSLHTEAAAAVSYPPHVVPNTELRVLPRTRSDRLYQLHIALPGSFREHPEKKYPVVFVTDGYWDFTTVVATYGNMVYRKNVPEMLVVGLGYAGKDPDYQKLRSDGPFADGWSGAVDAGGHAED
jgi:enterochelin esterase-like enzyme